MCMANRDNVRVRITRMNPQALAIMDLVDRKVKELGGTYTISVTLTGDMTRDEQVMALIEKYVKEGATIAEAESKAESTLAFLESF